MLILTQHKDSLVNFAQCRSIYLADTKHTVRIVADLGGEVLELGEYGTRARAMAVLAELYAGHKPHTKYNHADKTFVFTPTCGYAMPER